MVSATPKFEAPFTLADVPNVEIQGVRFTGQAMVPIGLFNASFDTAGRELTIDLTTDRARYAPGETVTLDVRTTDRSAQPVSASVVLRAVDEKLYAIGAAYDENPLGSLYRWVGTGMLWTHASHPLPVEGWGYGDTTGGGDGRSQFVDSVLFRHVMTDAQGRAQVSFKLSDDLTSWHVSADAMTSVPLAGSAFVLVPVGMPFFVEATIAPEYLASDRPIIRLRAYGSGLSEGDPVTFTVNSASLGLVSTTLRGTAFEEVAVPLPNLTPGTHAITIAASSGEGPSALSDRLTRRFKVIESRLVETRTTYTILTTGAVPEGGPSFTTYVFSDAGRGRYLSVLDSLAWSGGARVDQAVAASMARDLLIDEFDVDPDTLPTATFDPGRYQSSGVALLPYSSIDLGLSVRAALLAGDRFNHDELAGYLAGAVDDSASTREQRVLAYAGLAGLGEPVLAPLQAFAADPTLTIRERLHVGLGLAALGDGSTAMAIERDLLSAYGQRRGPWIRLQVGTSLDATVEATSLLALLAAALGDPLANDAEGYVDANPAVDELHSLQQVAFISRMLDRAPSAPGRFAYTIDGKRTVVDLGPGESFSLRLVESQRRTLSLEPLVGQIGLATSWQVPLRRESVARDSDLELARTYTPFPTIPDDAMVEVRLTATFGPQVVAGCHEVSDLAPSGLAPMEYYQRWSYDDTSAPSFISPYADRRAAGLLLRRAIEGVPDGEDALLRPDRDRRHVHVGVSRHPVGGGTREHQPDHFSRADDPLMNRGLWFWSRRAMRGTPRKRSDRRAQAARHRPQIAHVVAAVIFWACGASQPTPSATVVPEPAAPTISPAVPTGTPPAVSPATPAPSIESTDLFIDQVVVTVSDRVRVRSEPRVSDDSIRYEPVLALGTELTVLDGPVSASGYTWYKVRPLSFVGLDGPGFGWVATAGTDGEPWLALPEAPIAPTQGTPIDTLTWQRVPTATAIAGGGSRGLKLRYLATVPDGFMAVGGDARGAVVLSSPDGVQWTRARDNAAFDGASVRAVAARAVAARTGLTVAVGTRSGSARGLLWTTTDGLTWRDGGYAFAGNIEVVGVATGAGSFAVGGSFRTRPDAAGLRRLVGAAWTSADGRMWDRFVMPADLDVGDFRLAYLTFAGSHFVALGRASDIEAHPGMLVWTSADGREWRRGQDIPIGRDGSIADIALGPTGALIAVGWTTATPAHAAAFTSPDGQRWSPVPDGPAFEGAVMRGFACDERHCLAVGQSAGASPSNAAAWTTLDGVTWSRIDSMSGLGDVGMSDVALTDQGAIAIGWAVSLFEGAPYIDNAAFWTTPPVALPAPIQPPAVATIAGHWETLPSMMTSRLNPVVAVGKDGRIYVFGGKTRPVGTSTTITLSSVEIFDPATNAWSSGTPIPGPGRNRTAAVTAADGRILLFHERNSIVLAYDPALSVWKTVPSAPFDSRVIGAFAGPGRLMFVVTQHGADPVWLHTLDPVTGRWRSVGATGAASIASGADGLLYGISAHRAWATNPATGVAGPRSPTPVLIGGRVAPGPGGLIWEVGIETLHSPSASFEQWRRPAAQAYDPATDSWLVAPGPTFLRWGHAVAGTRDRLYVIGGSTSTYSNSVEAFVVDSLTTSATGGFR